MKAVDSPLMSVLVGPAKASLKDFSELLQTAAGFYSYPLKEACAARTLMSGRRNPWPDGKPTFAYKVDRFLFCVSVFGIVSCFAHVFTGSTALGCVLMVINAASAWVNFRGMAQERLKAYIGKVLDSSGRGEDPYEKAAIKFAVAWPLLDLGRKFYEDVRRAARGLPADLRTPSSVYPELVYMSREKHGKI